MKLITYISDAVKPGGTPKRYLEWVCLVLLLQSLSSVLPYERFWSSFNLAHVLFLGTVLISSICLVLKNDSYRIIAAYVIFVVGISLSAITIIAGITSLSGIIFMVTWAMTLFVAERREYISFDLVVLFMVLMLISTVVMLFFDPIHPVANNNYVLVTGAIITAVNIYLVYTDFGFEKNYYQESRKTYSNLNVLSSKLSDILSRKEKLDRILWYVARECVPFMEIEECVFYLYDENKGKLIQIAAYGNKSDDEDYKIVDPIEIEPGKGVVGRCFLSGKEELVKETASDPDYIVDDQLRNSELAVPIFSEGKVVGVIDSEHSIKGFFKQRHVQAFQIIASFCGIKITEEKAKKSIKDAYVAIEETQRMKELDEIKNRFITNISHDLKTPLSLIKAPALQIAQLTTDPKVQNQVNYILKNTEHLMRVVNQLLQLNRLDQGLNELYIEEVNTQKLADKIALQYKGLAEKDGVDFEMEIDAINLKTDSFRLEQIIHNLVHNAFRYSGKNGQVCLRIKADSDHLMIEVSDNGIGISDEMKTKVFERFVKVDVNNHEGTGIGLSLVKEYVESLGGKVSMKSKLGQGTSFFVVLPILEQVEAEAHELRLDEISSEVKPLLLVVEDHPDLNAFICSTFEEEFQCFSAFNGEEALRLMNKHVPDLIITDLMMPLMDGSEFIQQVREDDNYAHIPIVVLSAKGQVESKIELYELGADNYLVKPFDVAELHAIVKSTCEQRKRLKEQFTSQYLSNENQDSYKQVKPKNSLVERVIEFIKQNIENSELNIGMICNDLGVGRNKLQKEIREATSLSPVELLRSIRLNEARNLLQSNRFQVSEVAYMVGFNNLSYFSRAFKQEFDQLPSELV